MRQSMLITASRTRQSHQRGWATTVDMPGLDDVDMIYYIDFPY